MANKIKFFNGLNELRAIAAFAVIFHHIELFKKRDHLPSVYDYAEFFIEHLGQNAVYLFFVLSGFLITYLLFLEKAEYNKIFLGKFYLRRIFRIWPLYYLIMAVSFILIPYLVNNYQVFENTEYYYGLIQDESNYSYSSIILYITFLPNFAVQHGLRVPGASQSWSIGVEEQFYLIWPLILMFFTRRTIPYIFVLFLIWPFIGILKYFTDLPQLLFSIIKAIPFEFLAIGSIGAYFYFFFNTIVQKFSKSLPITLLVYSVLLIFLIVPVFRLFFYQKFIIGILFMLLIFIAIDDRNKLNLRNKTLFKLGKISYGIYMYHAFIMFLVFSMVNNYYSAENLWYYNFLIYFFIIGLTILFSKVSYEFLEKKFIRIKNKNFKLIK